MTYQTDPFLTVPTISYIVILSTENNLKLETNYPNELNPIFAHSFEFHSSFDCKSFYQILSGGKPLEINEIQQKILDTMNYLSKKEINVIQEALSINFDDFHVVCTNYEHFMTFGIFQIKTPDTYEIDYMESLAKGIMTTFFALNQQNISEIFPGETLDSLLKQSLPGIVQKELDHKKMRDCLSCEQRFVECIPNLIMKKI